MEGKKVFNNAKWIIGCKIIQSVLQLVVGMLSARYLGPSNFGLINYASSIVAFAIPFMRLGFNATLVHELVEAPEKEGEIIGTSMLMNIVSSFLCIIGVTAFASVANAGERVTVIVCILYSISLFFAALEMIQYWFQYKLFSKYSSLVMLGAYFVVSAYKIFLLVSGKNVYWFALSHSVEYGVIAIMLIIIYIKKCEYTLSFSISRAKNMFRRSKYYILSSLMVVIFQNTDHIMLTKMSGTVENGFYSAAISSVGVTQFVYMAIIDSFRPMIFASKKESVTEFEHNMSRLYSIIIYLAFAQSVVFTFAAPLIIRILYGAQYLKSIGVLRILTWYSAFSYMGTVRNIWLLANEKQKLLPYINLSGALFNVILNAVMIPFWGASGAAFASLLTQIFANFIVGFIIKPVRRNNILLLESLKPQFLASEIKQLYRIVKKKGSYNEK